MIRTLVAVAAAVVSLASSASAVDITIDANQKHQTIEGFGTCLISWDPKMAQYYEQPDAARIYAQELRFNFLRCNLWGDGTIGPTDDPEKISYQDPAFAAKDRRTPVFINFAKALQKYNPDLKVIGTVWSPPAWMKANNSIVDTRSDAVFGTEYSTKKGEITNYVKKEYYPHFAKWLVEMAKYYQSQGVPLYALSPANEPQFTQTFESCVWTTPDLVTILGMVGERLEKEGMGQIKLFGPEGMAGFNWEGGPNQQFVKQIQADPAAWKHFDVFAAHGYEDGFKADVSQNSSAQFWALIKDTGKPFWVTEGGTGSHDWPGAITNKGVAAALHNSLVAGNASAWVPWQFAEDARSENNLMPITGMSRKTQVVRQYSRFIPPGSVRVEASPAFGDVNASAFVLPGQGGLTIVLVNPSQQDQLVTLNLQGLSPAGPLQAIRTSAAEDAKLQDPLTFKDGKAQLTLPQQSIVTLTTLK